MLLFLYKNNLKVILKLLIKKDDEKKSIAEVLKENPDIKIKIEGHTDSDGDAAANLELSKLRADAVKKQLSTGFGIETARMQTAGAGENIPISPNDTPANKATNRRVEITKL